MSTHYVTQDLSVLWGHDLAARSKHAHHVALSTYVFAYLSTLQQITNAVNEAFNESLSLLASANNEELKGFIEKRIQSAKDRNAESTLRYKEFTASVLIGSLLPPKYLDEYVAHNIELYETLETTKGIIEGLRKTFGSKVYHDTKLGRLVQEKMAVCMPKIAEYQSNIQAKLGRLTIAETDRKASDLPLDYPNLFYDVELQEFVTSHVEFDSDVSVAAV